MREYDSCAGKVRFTSYSHAERVASRKRRNQNDKFAVYTCELCSGFHVGSHLGRGEHHMGMVPRQRFAVFASKDGGRGILVGWSAKHDGGGVEKIITQEPGWRVTRVAEIKRRAA